MLRRTVLLSLPGALLAGCVGKKPQFKGVDITGADYAQDFHLPDADGRMRSLKDFQGQVVLVFFGYTQCPDACPTTLSEIAQAKKLLGADGAKVQTVFISVDPERDTPQVLKAYMANFGPDFLGLRPADAQQLAAVTKDFKIYYKKVPGDQPGTYSMDHTAATFVYDPQGKLRLYERYASGPEALASDIKQLLAA
jgi:protein SCO1/2